MATKNSKTIPTHGSKGNLTGSIPTVGKTAPTVSKAPTIRETPKVNITKKVSKDKNYDSLEGHMQSWSQSEQGESLVASFEHPEWASGMCEEASASFASHLKRQGIQAEVLSLKHKATGAPHAVVKMDDTIIDWTLRQFVELADIPHLSTLYELEKTFTVLSSSPASETTEEELDERETFAVYKLRMKEKQKREAKENESKIKKVTFKRPRGGEYHASNGWVIQEDYGWGGLFTVTHPVLKKQCKRKFGNLRQAKEWVIARPE